ncbi:uncharacterized protein LOC119067465 [Bradysia coprophila]|uniref:uncharacterized protein LOC119067465 n=1 Tax=Bradysia coprophila TaxID=38358 RepID=UPI00187D73C0|nr:uncharacterized protein LOC119067465 [Bradysia coprophila]
MDHKRMKIDNPTLEPLNNTCDDLTVSEGSNDMTNLPNLPLEFTGTKLHDLNEDCLLEIFQLKTLDLYDVCSLADTCKRFRQIVHRIAPKELEIWQSFEKNDCYQIKLEITEYKIFNAAEKRLDKPCEFVMIKRIFANFGSNLVSVLIRSRRGLHCHLTDQVALHCKEKLKHLSLQCQEFSQYRAIEMQPIFKNLKSLKFYSLHLLADAKLFAGMDSLVELELVSVENGVEILENTFPKLERFRYVKGITNKHQLREYQLMSSLLSFIVRHNDLKILQFSGHISKDSAMIFCQTIVHNCKELDTFMLGCSTTRTSYCIKILTQLKSLRNLYLEHQSYSDLKVFAPMKELRHLNLSNCGLPLDLNQFDSWAHLTKIFLSTPNDFRSFDVVGVIKHLTNIEELELYASNKYILDEETVCEIVAVVCRRVQLLRLKCLYDFDWKEFDAGEKLQLLQTITFH